MFTSPHLRELEEQHAAQLANATEIRAKANAEKRALTTTENQLIGAAVSMAKRLETSMQEFRANNTLAEMFHQQGPTALFDAGRSRPAEQVQHQLPGKNIRTIREAMQFATPEELEQIQSFAHYIGGDMTALADLTPGGDAGVLIPKTIAQVITKNYAQFAPVESVAYVWPTNTGEPLEFPVVTDTESAVILAPAALTGADATVSGDHPPTALSGPTLNSYKFSSLPVFIPRETIADSVLNAMDMIFGALIARIIRLQNLKFTKGTGTAEPTGFMTSATAFSAGAVALDLDNALDLAYSVPALYRPNGVYMASDTTVKYLRKLKTGISGDKRSLWKDAFEEGNATLGTPAKLHGYPLIVNNDMDSVAADGTFAGVSPLAFGDFQKLVIRKAENGNPYVYRYTVPAKDGGAVIAFQRADSKLLVATAISKLTV